MNIQPITPARPLVEASRAVLLAGQADSGAYVASPTFSQYGFGWLRDGSYCALALAAIGEDESASRFHRWVAGVVESRADRIEAIVDDLTHQRPVDVARMLPTRYHLDGSEERDDENDWPNFQLDGYGTWLFALHAWCAGDPLPADLVPAARLAARYLAASWRRPCYDYWEEFGDRVHTSTLAAIAAGLRAAAVLLDEPGFAREADAVMQVVETSCVVDGVFVKGPQDDRVDGSLTSLATPFGLVAADDPRMVATVARMRADLSSPTGGIRRYVGDEYYGGSPWVLLTAWLGWHDRLAGDDAAYRRAVAWVEAAADDEGRLPEQVVAEPQRPDRLPVWEEKWGTVADPLLWSHAKYLLLLHGPEATTWR